MNGRWGIVRRRGRVELLLQEIRSVLGVVAHPDDAEYLFGGLVAKLVDLGAEANYVVCTDGQRGGWDESLTPEEMAETRKREQLEAAAILGVKEVRFLGYENGFLQATPELRVALVREIRRFKPDLVLTLPPYKIWDGPFHYNHWEHVAVGESTFNAVAPEAPSPRCLPDLLEEGFGPHRVREIWVPAFGDANRFIDVTDVLDRKLAAYRCHRSQNAVRGEPWDFEAEMGPAMRAAGEKVAAPYAEAFRAARLG